MRVIKVSTLKKLQLDNSTMELSLKVYHLQIDQHLRRNITKTKLVIIAVGSTLILLEKLKIITNHGSQKTALDKIKLYSCKMNKNRIILRFFKEIVQTDSQREKEILIKYSIRLEILLSKERIDLNIKIIKPKKMTIKI